MESLFTTLPNEILVELLSLMPTTSIINFYSVNSTHLKLFDAQHGLWEQLSRKIFCWGVADTPIQGRLSSILKSTTQHTINWKKEFRIASFIRDKLHHASFIKSHNPERLEIKSSHHFKGTTPFDVDYSQYQLGFPAILQSDTVLFPHPIGNFSTAYFEVELIAQNENTSVGETGSTSIGGALKDVAAYIGSTRSSFGINTTADVFLECDFTPWNKLTSPMEPGDIMGFGINFAKNSVFFTKNGSIVHEASQSSTKSPMKNLKNLHASISVLRDELRVNMGSHPFSFDLLKYQQNKAQPKLPLRLFSETIVPHLIAFQDDYYMKKAPIIRFYFADRNLPKPPFTLPHYLYLLAFGELHPESKIEIPPHQLSFLNTLRMLLNSMETFKSLDPVTEEAHQLLDSIAPIVEQQFQGFESMPWLEKVSVAENFASSAFHEWCMEFAGLYADELMECIKFSGWFESLLMTKELFFTERPNINGGDHWTKELMQRALDPDHKFQDVDDLYTESMYIVLHVRFTALQEIMMQRCKQIAEEKVADFAHLKKISCGDKLIEDNYKTVVQVLGNKANESVAAKKSGSYDTMHAHMDFVQVFYALQKPQLKDEKQVQKKLASCVIYGIYKLKLSPDNFSSAIEYVKAAVKENAKLITTDLTIRYLEDVVKVLHSLPKQQLLFGPLVLYFGFKLDADSTIEDLRIEVGRQIGALLQKYRDISSSPETNADLEIVTAKQSTQSRSTFGQRTMLIGAVAGLIGVGLVIGAYVLSQRKLRK